MNIFARLRPTNYRALVWLAAAALVLGARAGAETRGAGFISTQPVARIDYWQHRQADITAELKERQQL